MTVLAQEDARLTGGLRVDMRAPDPRPARVRPVAPDGVPAAILAMIPRWRCHKVVRAAEIVEFECAYPGKRLVTIALSETNRCSIHLDAGIFNRCTPKIGDMLMIYADGYISVSPRAEFDAGYSLEHDPELIPENAVHPIVATLQTRWHRQPDDGNGLHFSERRRLAEEVGG
jgi:hypothetical protein